MLKRLFDHARTPLFRNTYVLSLTRIASAGLGFIFWAIVARQTDPATVGITSATVALATLLAGLAQLGLGYGLVRHIAHTAHRDRLIHFAMTLQLTAAAALAALALLSLPFWGQELMPVRASPASVGVFVLLVLSMTLVQLLNWTFLATRQLQFSLAQQSFQSVVAIAALLAVPLSLRGYLASTVAYMGSLVASVALALAVFVPMVLPGYRPRLTLRLPERGRFAGYALANFLTDQINRAPDTLMPLIVVSLLGPSAGAYFFVVWMMGKSVGSWAGSIGDSLFAEVSHTRSVSSAKLRRAMLVGVLLAGGLALAMTAAGGILLTFYGADYVANGSILLALVAFASVPTVLIALLTGILRAQDQLRAVFGVTAVSNGAGLACSCIGMLRLGLNGAGIGWLAGQTLALLCVGSWWLLMRRRNTRGGEHRPAVFEQPRVDTDSLA